jgi:hypothetical protein
MHKLNFDRNLIELTGNFLSGRSQCVRFNGCFSGNLDMSVGAPQGMKLGPIFWILYSNDMNASNYNVIRYADDTTFYKSTINSCCEDITPAIKAAQHWSHINGMLLNKAKIVIMNFNFSQRTFMDDTVLANGILKPASQTKFLGIILDCKLDFSDHVCKLTSRCNSRLFIMLQLKRWV